MNARKSGLLLSSTLSLALKLIINIFAIKEFGWWYYEIVSLVLYA